MNEKPDRRRLIKNILDDFKEAGILGEGVVNYEVKYGLEEI